VNQRGLPCYHNLRRSRSRVQPNDAQVNILMGMDSQEETFLRKNSCPISLSCQNLIVCISAPYQLFTPVLSPLKNL
jgi:hypothetical protein